MDFEVDNTPMWQSEGTIYDLGDVGMYVLPETLRDGSTVMPEHLPLISEWINTDVGDVIYKYSVSGCFYNPSSETFAVYFEWRG